MSVKPMLGRLTVLAILVPLAVSALEFSDYYPLPMGRTWVYVSEGQPQDTFSYTVREPHDVGGQPAVRFGEEGSLEFSCWNDGTDVTWYHVWLGGVFIEIDPDLVLGGFMDGASFSFNCADCSQVLARDWDALDPIDKQVYGIDPGYAHLVLWAYYDADEPPNSQNAIVEANLPGGATPPPGAVTDIEWYQIGVGLTVYRDVGATDGELGPKYVLDEIVATQRSSWSRIKAIY